MISYRVIGNGDNVVLLHGWGFDSTVLLQFAYKLAQHFRVILIDLPGYGDNVQYAFPDTLLELATVLKNIIPSNAILIGWSLGGLLALQLALIKKSISNVIVIAGSPCFMAKINWPGMPELTFNGFYNQVKDNIELGLETFLYLNVHAKNKNKKSFLQLKKLIYTTPDKNTLLNGLNILMNTDLRGALEKIHCTIQFILAENDSLIDVKIAEHLTLYGKNIKVEIVPTANHAMVFFDADLIAEEMLKTLMVL